MSEDNKDAPEEQTNSAADNTEEGQVQDNETGDTDESADTDEESEKDKQEEGAKKEKKKSGWQQKRVDEVVTQRNAAQKQAEEYKNRVEELETKIAALQSGEKPDDASVQATIKRLAEEHAKVIVGQELQRKQFDEKAEKVWTHGNKEYDDFKESVANLSNSFGERWGNTAFNIVDGLDENAHKVIHYLGNDLDEADRILSLSPAKQLVELTKLEVTLSQPKERKQISKVPNPIKPVDSKTYVNPSLENAKSTPDFIRLRREQLKAAGKTHLL